MSSFKDTFTKEDAKTSLLEYDDSAFLYFACTCLFTILIPWSIYYVRRFGIGKSASKWGLWRQRRKGNKMIRNCECAVCVDKWASTPGKKSQLKTRLFTGDGLKHLIGLICLFGLTIFTLMSLGSMKTIAAFDPFAILEITAGATDKQIRKAYRTMSLKHHPDRNKNDPSAAAKFVLISKAYQTLTNEVAKRNFEKYGNPDGPGMMKVGIGLPKFFVAEESQLFFLCVFFVVMLVAVPMGFMAIYDKITKYTTAGVRVDTIHFLGCYLSEGTRVKQVLELLSSTAEARDIPLRLTDKEDIQILRQKIPMNSTLKAPPNGNLLIIKNQTLLMGHILRLHKFMTPNLREDLNQLLIVSMPITRSMMELAFINNWFFTVYAIVETRRSLIQALDLRKSSLYQIPHLDEDDVKKFISKRKTNVTLGDLLKKPEEVEKLTADMPPSKKMDIDAFFKIVPRISMTGVCEVEDEDTIVAGDLATINLKLKRENLQPNEIAGQVHAPLFPTKQYDEWWFFASDAQTGKMLSFATTKSRDPEVEVQITFPVRQVGAQAAVVVAMCDCYQDIDDVLTVKFTAQSPDKVQREILVHPEDLALDDQPTLFQQMMGDLNQDEDTDDEDENDNESNNKSA